MKGEAERMANKVKTLGWGNPRPLSPPERVFVRKVEFHGNRGKNPGRACRRP